MEVDEEITVASPRSAAALSQPASDDTEPSPPHPHPQLAAVKPARQLRWDHFERPEPNTKELKSDLAGFGFDEKQVKEMMSKREPTLDSTAQRPWGQSREQRGAERKGLTGGATSAARSSGRVAKRKVGDAYEPLVVSEGSSWVLFDPQAHDFPTLLGNQAPSLFQKFETYKPGNQRIVEIHPETSSVRVKATPKVLHGKAVEYAKTGPRIVKEGELAPPTQEMTVRQQQRAVQAQVKLPTKQQQPTAPKRQQQIAPKQHPPKQKLVISQQQPPTPKRKQEDMAFQPPSKRRETDPQQQPPQREQDEMQAQPAPKPTQQEEGVEPPPKRRPGRPRKTEAPAFTSAAEQAVLSSGGPAEAVRTRRPTRAKEPVVKTEPREDGYESSVSELTDFEEVA